ncbi:LacI family transcriptional regulator [Paraburkholderia sp. MMS20-SJTR3]|uniref:LacI family transcriptional regulator n=1 Tax=Paraburkholderia sejongensis TaxID=2886946 RepID=A0ABS8JS99_9BURK|nr:LacI family transcriptional regulator [Paraburkholderia sp. MMS20-SJTR3]
MNGTQRFTAAVEARLKEAIARLGYRSNPLARSMITGRTRAIGLAILDISNPHFTNLVKGANRVAIQHDYTLLLVDTEENPQREQTLIESLAQRVDGMIVSSRMPDDSVQWLLDLGKPVVLFGRGARFPVASVGTDSCLAGYMLANHLVKLGHRHIAYLGFGRSRWNDERIRGIRNCLDEYGLALDIHDAASPSAAGGERACSALVLGPKRPDAVICYNDLIALGFIKQARELGLQLPRDVSVAGFDNVPYGEYTAPALTTVDFQSEKMGELAMTKLLDQLHGNAETAASYSLLDPRLVVRESTVRREVAAGDAAAAGDARTRRHESRMPAAE